MHLGLLSQDRLFFDPLKPIILRGPPDDDTKSVFSGNVVLSLSKSTKVSAVSVTLKSIVITNWPEGIGPRGTRLSAERVLSEETLEVFREKAGISFPAGVHRFPFAFLVPNSIVETIEDTLGRVKHNVEARVIRSGMPLLSSLTVSKPVLVVRTYMSNSLLTNNSVQDLSRTLEKHTPVADIQIILEQAAFSSGETLHLRTIVQPQKKNVRMEQMEVTVTESRRYCEPELRGFRSETSVFPLHFKLATELLDGTDTNTNSTQIVASLFDKALPGIDLIDTFAHRMTFLTPTCQDNIHHTTHFKDIYFRHHLCITLILSYAEDDHSAIVLQNRTNISSEEQGHADSALEGSSQSATQGHNWHSKLFKFGKKSEKRGGLNRKREKIQLEVPIAVFDCRLKEDFGRLPSYFDLGAPTPDIERSKKGSWPSKAESSSLPETDEPIAGPHAYLCECYYEFARQMQHASQSPFLVTTTSRPPSPSSSLERIPSVPPPEYGVSP